MLKNNIHNLASLILASRSAADLSTRRACVVMLFELAESPRYSHARLGAVLSQCAAMANAKGHWQLAAMLRRAQDEVIHSLMPTPGHNVRKIFRKRRKVA